MEGIDPLLKKEIAEEKKRAEQEPVIIFVDTLPLYIIALHRLARLGKATRYGGSNNRFVQFELPQGSFVRYKWDMLKDAERVSIVYRDRR